MEWLDKVCEIPLNSFFGSELSFTLWANGYANKKNEFRDSMLETAKFSSCLVPGIGLLTWNPHFWLLCEREIYFPFFCNHTIKKTECQIDAFELWWGSRLLRVPWTAKRSNQSIFFFFLISWKLITLQYCSGFCHILKWISHGFTCVPHPDPPSHLPLHPIPRSSQCTRSERFSHASHLGWWSVSP